jgi:hypothetical protein
MKITPEQTHSRLVALENLLLRNNDEAMHSPIGENSFTLAPSGYQRMQYGMTIDGWIEVIGWILLPATYAGVIFATAPAPWQPIDFEQWPISFQTGLTLTVALTSPPACRVDTGGNYTLVNMPTGMSGNVVCVRGRFPGPNAIPQQAS